MADGERNAPSSTGDTGAPAAPAGVEPQRWPKADVLSLAPDLRALEAADDLAVGSLWRGLGCDTTAVWGLYHGAVAEPYQVVVTLAGPHYRCTCPSRQRPCKHALALLVLWSDGVVLEGAPPGFVQEAVAREAAVAAGRARRAADPVHDTDPASGEQRQARRPHHDSTPPRQTPLAPPPPPPDKRAQERAARVAAGMREFEQWVTDAVRTGLTAPEFAQYRTWDAAAARLVDAQAPSLANRVRRLAGAVGTRPAWHEYVLAELGTLHLLCRAGQHLWDLELTHPALAESVRTALGRTIRQADVLGGPGEPDLWMVCGRSEVLEDRFVVRREWLRAMSSQQWALLLSFAAAGQRFADPLRIGAVVSADMHRYPGLNELRCIPEALADLGDPPEPLVGSVSVGEACRQVGDALSGVPWLERWPITLRAAPTRSAVRGSGPTEGRWVLSDHTGSLPISTAHIAEGALPALVALSGGRPVDVMCEWTPEGVVPLAVHLGGRSIDLGPQVRGAHSAERVGA